MRKKTFRAALSLGLAAGMIISGMGNFRISAFPADEYIPRLTAPKDDPKEPEYQYYFSDENHLFKIGYGMPNCTAYAWGRIFELTGKKPKLSTDNAGRWYTYNSTNKIYSYGCVPKLGAVACWDKNDAVNGHVAVVEKISKDKSQVTVSESQWDGEMFITYTYQSDSSDHMSKYRFLGYIYPDETSGKNYGDAYRIKSSESDRILTNTGKNKVSVDILKTQTAFQNFRFEMTSKGSYRIYSLTDDKALTRKADEVILSDENGTSSEWVVYRESDTEYTIVDIENENNVLSIDGDTGKIEMSAYTAEKSQLWKLGRLTGVSGISTFIREKKPEKTGFWIDIQNTKLNYLSTEFPDLTGIKFYLNSREITDPDMSKLRVYYNFNKAGKTSIKIIYDGMSAEYEVNVIENKNTDMSIPTVTQTEETVTEPVTSQITEVSSQNVTDTKAKEKNDNVSEETKNNLKDALIKYLIEYQNGNADESYDVNKDTYISVSDLIALFK